MKWLRSIRISDSESTNWYHLHDNRMFPSAVETENDLDDGWRGHPGGLREPGTALVEMDADAANS